uniref:Uncharacterized protein n=1 Tax=Aegilops tauschii subsp. strangulata TaxID=200361 RepID=A0A452ZZ27_AEGTS
SSSTTAARYLTSRCFTINLLQSCAKPLYKTVLPL